MSRLSSQVRIKLTKVLTTDAGIPRHEGNEQNESTVYFILWRCKLHKDEGSEKVSVSRT